MPHIFKFRLKKSQNKKISKKNKPNHWMFKVQDGKNFQNSKHLGIWGISSKGSLNKIFIDKVKIGDKLWFIKYNKQIIGVADYKSHTKRMLGPLINLTYSDKELGWENMSKIDTEIKFENLKDIDNINFKYQFNFISDVTLNNQMNSYMNMGHEYEKLVAF
jgi:hypothetical protein